MSKRISAPAVDEEFIRKGLKRSQELQTLPPAKSCRMTIML
jgi:hypothetical protein